jgi:protein-S-isoprenylcysteine O-methyltransferase Ste14
MAAARTRPWAFRARGPVGAALLVMFGVLGLCSTPGMVAGSWPAIGVQALAWLVFVTGAALRFWSTLYIGGRKTYALACEGPYSLTRNPLYLGSFLLWTSAALFFGSLTFGVGVVLAMSFYVAMTVPAEERRLRLVLGDAYEDYCRQVPRFWPRARHFRTAASIDVDTHALWVECRRAARWIWLPMIAELVAQARSAAWWPCWFDLP